MTIKEYQAKFVELFNQLQNEHGEVESVEIVRKTFSIMGVQGYEPIIKITFETTCSSN